jgi:hypothetical protein
MDHAEVGLFAVYSLHTGLVFDDDIPQVTHLDLVQGTP